MATEAERAQRVWSALGGEGQAPAGMAQRLAKLHDNVRSACGSYDIGEVGDCGRMAEYMAKWLNVDTTYDEDE